jgi:hypothetical protein
MFNWRLPTVTALVLLSACSDSGNSNGGGGSGGGSNSVFTGIVTSDDGLSSGALTFTIPATSLIRTAPTGPYVMGSLSVTGSINYAGAASVALSGTYDATTDALSLSGGGFTLDGSFDGVDRLEGTMSGAATGTFVTTKGNSAAAYCGTYTQTAGGADDGTFSFVIAGAKVRGTAVSSQDGSVIPLDGTFAGSTINIFIPGSSTSPYLATGTKSGTTVSGTFDNQTGGTGTWTGAVCP